MLVAATLAASDAVAAVPEGPRLALTQVGPSFLGAKVITVGPTGADRQILASGRFKRPPLPIGRATWSPDGSRLVFAAMTSRLPTRRGIPKQLFLLAADGRKPRPLKGTGGGVSPVFAPDGHSVAFGKEKVVVKLADDEIRFYSSTSIWLFDIETGKSRQLTPWRNGLRQEPSSFSPDGSVIASTRIIDEKRPEAIGVKLDGGSSALVPGSASEPVFSPDGTRIAFVRGPVRRFGKNQDLYTARPGGEDLRRLTKTPTLNEAFPSWDPSGQRLAYGVNGVISSPAELFGVRGGIRAVNADGTCVTDLLEYSGAFLAGPAWQPGPGREAGPLSC